jgi:hypothetical protein
MTTESDCLIDQGRQRRERENDHPIAESARHDVKDCASCGNSVGEICSIAESMSAATAKRLANIRRGSTRTSSLLAFPRWKICARASVMKQMVTALPGAYASAQRKTANVEPVIRLP